MRGRKTRFQSVAHGETADGRPSVDDDGGLGLRDAVVYYLGCVERVEVSIAGSLSACRRFVFTYERLRL